MGVVVVINRNDFVKPRRLQHADDMRSYGKLLSLRRGKGRETASHQCSLRLLSPKRAVRFRSTQSNELGMKQTFKGSSVLLSGAVFVARKAIALKLKTRKESFIGSSCFCKFSLYLPK